MVEKVVVLKVARSLEGGEERGKCTMGRGCWRAPKDDGRNEWRWGQLSRSGLLQKQEQLAYADGSEVYD